MVKKVYLEDGREIRPYNWVTGPDPKRHEQHLAWSRHKAQANFRKERHNITFEQWEELWNTDNRWENRGRQNHNVNMTKIIDELGWTYDNCQFLTREEMLRIRGLAKRGTKYKKRSQK